MKKILQDNLKNFWFWLFIAIAVASAIIMPVLSLDAGNSGDEDAFQIPQAENVINWFKTDGADTTCLNFKSNLQYYGASFDVITAFINHTFHIDDIHTTRHICNSLLGWFAILTVGLIACMCGGFRAGCFAMLLLFFSPRFLGHSFNNPKDLPFASAVIFSIFSIMLFFKQFPKIKWYTLLMLALSIAFAISVRIGGLIIFGYFGLYGLIYIIHSYITNKKELKNNKLKATSLSENISGKNILRMIVAALAVCVAGYFIGLILWPYALQAPIKHPIEAFKLMSSFDVSLRQLFEGKLQWSDTLPWYYTPKYILMTIPVTVIAGVLLFFIFCWRKGEDRIQAFFLFFTFFFPIFWIVYTKANVYGGWRHAMFAYPPMVAAAGWGIDALIKWVEKKLKIENVENADNGAKNCSTSKKRIITDAVCTILFICSLAGPIRHTIANHPYEYVYFNTFAGGIEGAYGQYEIDYYYHSTREATEWVIANAEPKADGSKNIVATWHLASVDYFLRNDTARFIPRFCRWYEKGNSDWDYAIFTVTGMQPEQITNKDAFPPMNCVHTIDVDGKPICLILKRESKDDLRGHQYRQESKIDSSLYFLNKAVAINPHNEAALINLIEIYYTINQPDSAKIFIDMALNFMSSYDRINYYLAQYYINKNQIDEAEKTYKKIISSNPLSTQAYFMLCNIYFRKNDIRSAEKTLNKLVEMGRVDQNVMGTLIQIYKSQGMSEHDAYKKLYKKMADSFEALGKKEEAQQCRETYEKLKQNYNFR